MIRQFIVFFLILAVGFLVGLGYFFSDKVVPEAKAYTTPNRHLIFVESHFPENSGGTRLLYYKVDGQKCVALLGYSNIELNCEWNTK